MKQCRYCKTENSDQATECASCGLSLEFAEQIPDAEAATEAAQTEEWTEVQRKAQEETARAAATKKKKRHIILAAVAGVLAVVLLAVVLSQTIFQTNSKFILPETSLHVVHSNQGEAFVLISETKVVGEPVEGELTISSASLDGTVRVLKGSQNSSVRNAIATKDGVLQLPDVGLVRLSVLGDCVAYANENFQLYLQTIPQKKDAMLLSDRILTYSAFAISPDGTSVAYTEEVDGEANLYVYQQEKRTKIGSNLLPVTLSNQGTYIYCVSLDNQKFYLADMQGNLTEVADTPRQQYLLNQDHTQMLFLTDDGWFVLDHGEKKEVSDSSGINAAMEIHVATPTHANQFYDSFLFFEDDTSTSVDSVMMRTYPVENLAENYYSNDTYAKLSYLDQNWAFQELTQELYLGTTFYNLSEDGNTICYLAENVLYRIQNADLQQKEKIVEEDTYILSFAMTSDGEAVYYLDGKMTLWYQKGTASAVKIADSVEKIALTHDNYLLYLPSFADSPSDGSTLYAVKDGGTPKQVADRVAQIFTSATATYYYQVAEDGEDNYNLYGAKKGVAFQFITQTYEHFFR